MTDKTKHKSVSRRSVLKAVGGLGVVASAGALAPRLFTPAVAGPAPKVRLAWTEVAACHSPLGFGALLAAAHHQAGRCDHQNTQDHFHKSAP